MSELQTTGVKHQTETQAAENRSERTRKRKHRLSIVNMIIVWLLLVFGGLYGAYMYMNHVEQKLSLQLEQKTEERIQQLQVSYDKRLGELDESYSTQMDELNTQITSLNELLTFVKDNASSDNSDSNKLYTQINEIKTQLQKLQKSMELLES